MFLDEVGNLSMETQGKLLRVLETQKGAQGGRYGRAGSIDIRLIAATNRELDRIGSRRATFREDLYYRLNVVPIFLPPLARSARRYPAPGDVPSCSGFQQEAGRGGPHGFTPDAMFLLENYGWPGNVRELRNIVERMAILCDAERIELQQLPAEVRQSPPRSMVSQLPKSWEDFKRLKQQVRDAAVEELERRFLTEALQRCSGNVSKAAEEVGIQRTNFHALLRKYGISGDSGG